MSIFRFARSACLGASLLGLLAGCGSGAGPADHGPRIEQLMGQGDYGAARALLRECLLIAREVGDAARIAQALNGLADNASALGHVARGAVLWGMADRLREEFGAAMAPNDLSDHKRLVADARAALVDDAAFDAAWAEGRAMTLEQAVTLALTPLECGDLSPL